MAQMYLLHFSSRYPGGQKPQHYLGVAVSADARFIEHKAGSSKSRLTRACKERGIDVDLVRTWNFPYPKAAFDRERAEKRRKEGYARLCPICTPKLHHYGVQSLLRSAHDLR